MNFEDIVDMDWLNSHTVDSLPSPAKEEPLFPDYTLDYPMYDDSFYSPTSPVMIDPPVLATTTTTTTATTTTTVEESTISARGNYQGQKQQHHQQQQEVVIPSTEQIKLLIELAKKQLALREQQARAGGLTPEPDTPPMKLEDMPSIKFEEIPTETITNTTTTTTQTASLVPQSQNTATITSSSSTTAGVVSPAAAPLSLFPPTVPIPDTISPESLMKTEKQMRRDSTLSEDGPMSLEAYAESDGIDIKKLTSKERRQLRNKISARNFRVRRKEYISTLEAQVDEHKKSNQLLMDRLNTVEEENKQLKLQLDNLKRQNQMLQQNSLPNLNKDIGVMGSKPTETYRQDTSILVS